MVDTQGRHHAMPALRAFSSIPRAGKPAATTTGSLLRRLVSVHRELRLAPACRGRATDVILRPATRGLTSPDHPQAEGSIMWRAERFGDAPILDAVRFGRDLPA